MASEPRSDQDIVNEFTSKRERFQRHWTKITELAHEAQEHETVLQVLEPYDKDRKCFRLVGDVLVERTVGETLPAVQKNKEQLENAINTLTQQLEAMKQDLADFQAKYKIRVTNNGVDGADDREEQSSASGKGQGVLVSKS